MDNRTTPVTVEVDSFEAAAYEEAVAAATQAIASQPNGIFDSIRSIAATAVTAAAPFIEEGARAVEQARAADATMQVRKTARASFLKALVEQLDMDVETGNAAALGFEDGELSRFKAYLVRRLGARG